MSTYNGHKNYNAWNVSLWLTNDESLYRQMIFCIRATTNRKKAVEKLFGILQDMGMTETPDGVKVTKTNVQLAMVGIGR